MTDQPPPEGAIVSAGRTRRPKRETRIVHDKPARDIMRAQEGQFQQFEQMLDRRLTAAGNRLLRMYMGEIMDQLQLAFGQRQEDRAPLPLMGRVQELENRLQLYDNVERRLAPIEEQVKLLATLPDQERRLAALEQVQGQVAEISDYLKAHPFVDLVQQFNNKFDPLYNQMQQFQAQLVPEMEGLTNALAELRQRPDHSDSVNNLKDKLRRYRGEYTDTLRDLNANLAKIKDDLAADRRAQDEHWQERWAELHDTAADDREQFTHQLTGIRGDVEELRRLLETVRQPDDAAGAEEGVEGGYDKEAYDRTMAQVFERLGNLERTVGGPEWRRELDRLSQAHEGYTKAAKELERAGESYKAMEAKVKGYPYGRDAGVQIGPRGYPSLLETLRRQREALVHDFPHELPGAQASLAGAGGDFLVSTGWGDRLAKLYPRLGDASAELSQYYASKLPYLWRRTNSAVDVLEEFQKAVSGATRHEGGDELTTDSALDNPREVLEWVKSQKGTDQDVAVKFQHDLEGYMGGQQFKIARGKLLLRSLENLKLQTAAGLRALADLMHRPGVDVQAYLDALKNELPGDAMNKNAVAAYWRANKELGDTLGVEGGEDAEGNSREQEKLTKFRELAQQYNDFDKDIRAVKDVIKNAKDDMQKYKMEYNGVMDYLKTFEADDPRNRVGTLADSVKQVMETLREEKQHQRELQDNMRHELASHRADVEKLVRNLWNREPVEQIVTSVPRTHSQHKRMPEMPQAPAVPRGTAPGRKEQRAAPALRPPPPRETGRRTDLWARMLGKYRQNR